MRLLRVGFGRGGVLVSGTLATAAVLLHFLPASWVLVDTWGRLAFGRLILDTGGVPAEDPFAYVPTLTPWIYHEWLSDVLVYWVVRDFGGEGLLFLRACLWLGTLALAYATARACGAGRCSSGITILAAAKAIAIGFGFFRPQAFGFFLFALELYVLVSARHGGWGRSLWIVPLMVVWANLHGGFLAGLGTLWAFVAGRAISARRPGGSTDSILALVVVAAAASAATLCNPWGLDYWRFLVDAVTMPRPYITEWESVFSLPPSYQAIFAGLAGTAVAVALFSDLRRDPAALLVIAVTLAAATLQLRHVPFFAIVFAGLLPAPLETALAPALRRVAAILERNGISWIGPTRALAVVVALSIALLVGRDALSPRRWRVRATGRHVPGLTSYPFAAAEFIRQNGLSGNLAVPFIWGEFIIWKLYPLCRVSFDGRYETVYGEQVAQDNWNFVFGRPGWERLLSDYPTEIVLVDRRLPQYRRMRWRPDWRIVFEDEISAVFVPNLGKEREWKIPIGVPTDFP